VLLYGQKQRWWDWKESENRMKVKWKNERVKVIRYDDLIENVVVNAIIYHDYMTDMTYIHDLLIYV